MKRINALLDRPYYIPIFLFLNQINKQINKQTTTTLRQREKEKEKKRREKTSLTFF